MNIVLKKSLAIFATATGVMCAQMMASSVAFAQVAPSCGATGVIMNFGTSKTLLDVSINGAAPVKVAFASQANTTFVSPVTNFANGEIVSYTGTLDASGVICNATTMVVSAAPVVDTVPPVITVLGTNPVTIVAGDVYTDAGATCVDNIDATCVVVTSGIPADTTIAGTYTISYVATDAAGNSSFATRTLIINPLPVVPPVVSTGKKVEVSGAKITLITPTKITVGKTVLLIDSSTVVKLENKKPLQVGTVIEYKGILNSDGTISATSIKAQ